MQKRGDADVPYYDIEDATAHHEAVMTKMKYALEALVDGPPPSNGGCCSSTLHELTETPGEPDLDVSTLPPTSVLRLDWLLTNNPAAEVARRPSLC